MLQEIYPILQNKQIKQSSHKLITSTFYMLAKFGALEKNDVLEIKSAFFFQICKCLNLKSQQQT